MENKFETFTDYLDYLWRIGRRKCWGQEGASEVMTLNEQFQLSLLFHKDAPTLNTDIIASDLIGLDDAQIGHALKKIICNKHTQLLQDIFEIKESDKNI